MRIRITFAKLGALRYTGNLDLHKMWERTARRADLALAYSQGFHPQPKMQLAAALPLGFSSRCELIDIRLDERVELESLPERLQSAVPIGLKILKVEEIDESSPPLQTQVIAGEYEVTIYDEMDGAQLTQSLDSVTGAASILRERRGKPYDLRPLIEELRRIEPDEEGHPRLFMRLTSLPSATGRPEEVLDALGIQYEGTRVERSRFIFKS